MLKHAWEFMVLLVIGGFVVKAVIGFVAPLIPYMVVVLVAMVIAYGYFRSKRSW